GAVETRGVDDDDLHIFPVHQTANWVTGSFWLVSGNRNLLTNQCIRQRGLAGIWPTDKAHETGAKALRGVGVLSVLSCCFSSCIVCSRITCALFGRITW